jgi:mRNA interferase HicA
VGDQSGAKAVADETGLHIRPGRGGHLTVRLGDKITDLPMHGKKRDLPTGTVNAIKKALGLK